MRTCGWRDHSKRLLKGFVTSSDFCVASGAGRWKIETDGPWVADENVNPPPVDWWLLCFPWPFLSVYTSMFFFVCGLATFLVFYGRTGFEVDREPPGGGGGGRASKPRHSRFRCGVVTGADGMLRLRRSRWHHHPAPPTDPPRCRHPKDPNADWRLSDISPRRRQRHQRPNLATRSIKAACFFWGKISAARCRQSSH